MDYPKYNSLTQKYEITNKEELMAMSSGWCPKMPRDGRYILMKDIDMSSCKNFTPIGHKKERAFIGTFDGNYCCIKNLTIKHEEKYVALFRYLGNSQNPNAKIKNLYIKDCDIKGSQNVAGIVGVNYGIVNNCVVEGNIKTDSNTGSHTVGGISGKNKVSGYISDCFVNVNIEGSYDIGGISGIQEEGGTVDCCFVAGNLVANDQNGMVGGVVGAFNAGHGIKNCVVALNSIQGEKYIGKIVGQFDDETGENITNNIVWEGTKMLGNESYSGIIKMTSVTAKMIHSKDIYEGLGWDLKYTWELDEHMKIPMLIGFSYDIKLCLNIDYPIITSTAVDRIERGQDLKIEATVLNDDNLTVDVNYWDMDKKDIIHKKQMTKVGVNNYAYTIKDISQETNRIYYYIAVQTKKGIETWPHNIKSPIGVNIGDYGIQKKPQQITLTLGKDDTQIGVNWITHEKITDTILWYKPKDCNEWTKRKGETNLLKGAGLSSHRVLMTNLKPDTVYQYKIGDDDGNTSEVLEFKQAGDTNFSFLFVTDSQAVSEKDYMAFRKCLDYAIPICNPDFIVNAGDVTQNGYKSSEWRACFDVLGEYFERYPTITIPGNHEDKGDKYFKQYTGRFFMPGANLGTPFDGTIGEFEYKNAHIVTVNTEIMDDEKLREKQLKWLEDTFINSNKKWKILVIHRGMYMVNHNSKKTREYFADILEKVGVKLVLNGHDHIYTRAIKNGITYITGGTVGNKFYEYVNEEELEIDVFRDKKGCQTYSVISVNNDFIDIEVYSKENENDWKSFRLIDRIKILD